MQTAMLSACRIGQHGAWQLKFEDPRADHPKGKFKCEACYAAADRDWDPCEEYHRRRDAEAERLEAEGLWDEDGEEEDQEEGDDVEDQHAATRQHILNMQVACLLALACLLVI